MGLVFDRAVFNAYDRTLWPFTLEPTAERGRRECSGSRVCMALQASVAVLSLLLLAATATLHAGHVGTPGCLGAQLELAAAYWGNTTAANFFRLDDVLRRCCGPTGSGGGGGGSGRARARRTQRRVLRLQFLQRLS